MSETWKGTREAYQRLRDALKEADEDTQYEFGFWVGGQLIMAGAIIAAFGFPGISFCVGYLIWRAGK